MKTLLLILSLFSITSLSANATDQSFEFRHAGKVQFSDFEREISPGVSYADVKILNIRNSLNPLRYVVSLISVYNQYVITMKLNNTDEVSCRLTEITDGAKFMINDCKSNSASVSHVGYIYYQDLGISVNRY